MTAAAPEGSALRGTPAANTPGHKPRGRTLIAVIVGLVVFAAAAVGGFALEDGFTASLVGRTIDCGEFQQCVPGLQADDVIGALEAAGHTCRREPERVACTLEIGLTSYETSVHSVEGDGQVTEVMGHFSRPDETQSFGFPEDAPPPRGVVPYFSWMASLPFADDQTAASDITTWVKNQVDRGGEGKVQFGDYYYEMTAEGPGGMSLIVRAQRPFES
jgi:hypothetical protein